MQDDDMSYVLLNLTYGIALLVGYIQVTYNTPSMPKQFSSPFARLISYEKILMILAAQPDQNTHTHITYIYIHTDYIGNM